MYTYVYVYICIYIYIYTHHDNHDMGVVEGLRDDAALIEKARERERETE